MNLLFRKKKLVLKAYTHNSCAYEFFTVAKAHYFYPEWWKKLPSYHQQEIPRQEVGAMTIKAPTMKTCAGIIDIYKHGIVLPLWSDLQIKVTEHGQWAGVFSDPAFNQVHCAHFEAFVFVLALHDRLRILNLLNNFARCMNKCISENLLLNPCCLSNR